LPLGRLDETAFGSIPRPNQLRTHQWNKEGAKGKERAYGDGDELEGEIGDDDVDCVEDGKGREDEVVSRGQVGRRLQDPSFMQENTRGEISRRNELVGRGRLRIETEQGDEEEAYEGAPLQSKVTSYASAQSMQSRQRL
jgi:hypothetical protein